jgi:peptidyl-prolyl cis-trans isomerase C
MLEEMGIMRKSLLITGLFVAIAGSLVLAGPSDAADPPKDDKVLAKVGNETIKDSDLRLITSMLPGTFGPSQMTPDQRKKAVQHLVSMFVLAAQAEKDGMDKNPEVARPVLFYKNNLLAHMYLSKSMKDAKDPTEKDAKDYYEKNPAMFTVPESVHLHHIQVASEQEAKDALARVKKGEKFADLAAQISLCPSKPRGGDLGWIHKGALVQFGLPELETVSFQLTKGQTSAPIKSKLGYHIVMVEERKAEEKKSFDDVKDFALEQMKFVQRQDSFDKLADSLKKSIKVEIDENAVQGQLAPAGPDPK